MDLQNQSVSLSDQAGIPTVLVQQGATTYFNRAARGKQAVCIRITAPKSAPFVDVATSFCKGVGAFEKGKLPAIWCHYSRSSNDFVKVVVSVQEVRLNIENVVYEEEVKYTPELSLLYFVEQVARNVSISSTDIFGIVPCVDLQQQPNQAADGVDPSNPAEKSSTIRYISVDQPCAIHIPTPRAVKPQPVEEEVTLAEFDANEAFGGFLALLASV